MIELWVKVGTEPLSLDDALLVAIKISKLVDHGNDPTI